MSETGARGHWRRLVSAWASSGMTREEFATRAGVNAGTLSWWKWKLSHDDEVDEEGEVEEDEASVAFVEIESHGLLQLGRASVELVVAGVEVRVPDGFNEDTLARVVTVLEARR